ncbi:MAG TPA: (2Fe-2S)-binding protein [Mycobacterium sp.]|jgi:bacterioferritin-associated ferredoxin|nr:(2Fe-2S)-binding protein [Mycobacterium sp.]
MYVCHCRTVTLWAIRSAIASGARSVDDITANCRAGDGCGGCRRLLQAFLDVSWGPDGSIQTGATGAATQPTPR